MTNAIEYASPEKEAKRKSDWGGMIFVGLWVAFLASMPLLNNLFGYPDW